MPIIIDGLSHIYHENTALQTAALEGVSLRIEKGGWTSFIGHTGSGKSTLAQHLNAVLRPTAGTVSETYSSGSFPSEQDEKAAETDSVSARNMAKLFHKDHLISLSLRQNGKRARCRMLPLLRVRVMAIPQPNCT